MKNNIDLWANFLMNEKLDPEYLNEDDILQLIKLSEEAGKIRGPLIRSHKDKLESREFLCNLAMDLGIDLMAIKRKKSNKPSIGRGLLDAWQKVYLKKFGGTYGTAGTKEIERRDIKTRLSR